MTGHIIIEILHKVPSTSIPFKPSRSLESIGFLLFRGNTLDLGSLMLLKMLRLARLARLIRALRYPIFRPWDCAQLVGIRRAGCLIYTPDPVFFGS